MIESLCCPNSDWPPIIMSWSALSGRCWWSGPKSQGPQGLQEPGEAAGDADKGRFHAASDNCRDGAPFRWQRSPVTARVALLMGYKQCSCKDINLPSLCELWRGSVERRTKIHVQVQIFRLRSLRIVAYTIMLAGVAYCVAIILEALLVCIPIRYNWDKSIDGHCGNSYAGYLFVAIADLITELSIIILPMPYVWSLQLPVGKKIALTCIFGLGIM